MTEKHRFNVDKPTRIELGRNLQTRSRYANNHQV